MPVSYCFMKKGTEEKVTISQVDDEVRAYLGLPPDPDNCCGEYEILALTGTSASWNGKMTEESYQAVLSKLKGSFRELVEEFLGKRYDFDAWRSSF